MSTFALGPWEPLDGNDGAMGRFDAQGRMGAAVYPPDARANGWHWFALAPNGEERYDHAPSKALAQAAADAAIVELGGAS